MKPSIIETVSDFLEKQGYPCPGDPVIVPDYNQHDGHSPYYEPFTFDMLDGSTIFFRTYKEYKEWVAKQMEGTF